MKSTQIKTAAELRAVFNRASENISTCHNVRQLQGLSSCGAFRKPPISEANWGTGFSIKTLEQWKKVHSFTLFQSAGASGKEERQMKCPQHALCLPDQPGGAEL